MNVLDLLSAMQYMIQRGRRQENSTGVATVYGYTVPQQGALMTPEVEFILAYQPPQKRTIMTTQRRSAKEAKWAEKRFDEGIRRTEPCV